MTNKRATILSITKILSSPAKINRRQAVSLKVTLTMFSKFALKMETFFTMPENQTTITLSDLEFKHSCYFGIISNSVENFLTVNAGGSISNMYGMVLARHKAVPDTKTRGLSGMPPLVVFTSEDVSHVHFLPTYNISMSISTLSFICWHVSRDSLLTL
jgi:hypothetical protein